MTTFERDAKTLELPWPFTGRDSEVELIRRSLAAGRHGIVVTGAAGSGKTRLAAEATHGSDRALVAGTPEARALPFAAFAHLLPEDVTLHRAVQLLSSVRQLIVDDAHLLDDASAALVHQLAVQGRTRLLVVATDGAPAPGAISRLWTGELLPRLALDPLPPEETEHLIADGGLEPLTVNRLHRLCRGDLRLLRDLVGAVRKRGLLTRVPDSDTWAWRGPLPLTPTVRERTAHVLDRVHPEERETLERLAFCEPLAPHMDEFDLWALERLEADGLIRIDDAGAVLLVHPLHGPALRAAAGRLRARRLARTPEECGRALDAETAVLRRSVQLADVRAVSAPVGEWLVDEGAPVPAEYAAVRARFARFGGRLLEAEAWAREGLRDAPRDEDCRRELALAVADAGDGDWPSVTRGDLDAAPDEVEPYDAVRLGVPERAVGRLDGVFAQHADALARGDGPALDRAAEALRERGLLLYAAEAHAQAVRAHRDPRAARTSRTRAVALARRCQGARTPALSGLVLGELTARQRQIVTLAAAGLSNREIAERLTLSVRTVGNHLYSAYARLGASDRGALSWMVELPDAQPA
ncbi:LuxR C-terminal-related transcriptional regulator [Streptomyces sp. G1]|uniref:LuxR family transcriptional regulator AbsR2 n=1 Tax=Streptomyces sp. G1 TaxID=361572 RepID=UPI00202E80E1|nr:LuxR C-terminal-related transcriptional regulator [Streptomyces sp. G1]MCM1973093.1 LuxR C-terminal-related transcriptional regulator [Streptomyces sp. G1]